MIGIGHLGTKTARVAPDRAALIDPKVGLTRTFGQLESRTENLARALTGLFEAGNGRRVAALSQNCIDLMELYLATAKAGSLLFPVNWRFSPTQVRQALEAATPSVVFYHSDFRDIIAEVRGTVDIEHWIEWTPGRHSEYEEVLEKATRSASGLVLPNPQTLLHQPYLAISTGGTTGIPKSAVHTQYSYSACMLDYLAAARVPADDTYLMLGQPSRGGLHGTGVSGDGQARSDCGVRRR